MLKALGFQMVESVVLSSHWFQIDSTCEHYNEESMPESELLLQEMLKDVVGKDGASTHLHNLLVEWIKDYRYHSVRRGAGWNTSA